MLCLNVNDKPESGKIKCNTKNEFWDAKIEINTETNNICHAISVCRIIFVSCGFSEDQLVRQKRVVL